MQYFTLFFLPLFKTGSTGQYVQCLGCGREYTTAALRVRPPTQFASLVISVREDLDAGKPIQTVRKRLQNTGIPAERINEIIHQALGDTLGVCESCNLSYSATLARCPRCGNDLAGADWKG
jgi:uncharacterized paraquat-inducible protein A